MFCDAFFLRADWQTERLFHAERSGTERGAVLRHPPYTMQCACSKREVIHSDKVVAVDSVFCHTLTVSLCWRQLSIVNTSSCNKPSIMTDDDDENKQVQDEEDEDEEDLEKLQAEIARMEQEAAKLTKETEELAAKGGGENKNDANSSGAPAAAAGGGDNKTARDRCVTTSCCLIALRSEARGRTTTAYSCFFTLLTHTFLRNQLFDLCRASRLLDNARRIAQTFRCVRYGGTSHHCL